MNSKYLTICVTVIVVVVLGGSLADLAIGADPTRLVTIITIVFASTITPLFALNRIGHVNDNVKEVNGKADSAATSAAAASAKTDRVLNGEMEAKIEATMRKVLAERDAAK